MDASARGNEGGMARFFVEHREVGWLALVATLIWGGIALFRLAQQEDPKIPERVALVVTAFPGATALQVEQLVTDRLEKKISELDSIEEVTSQSRLGVSVITVKLRPAARARIEQDWDKLRARLTEVSLPEGAHSPRLNTDFGNTVTLLFGIASPQASEAECVARANLIRNHLADLRGAGGGRGRAAVFAFYPASVSQTYRLRTKEQFLQSLRQQNRGTDIRSVPGESFILADFATTATRAELSEFVAGFIRTVAGSDSELHPDFGPIVILMGDDDPLPALRAGALPRYSYRQLELAANQFEDELKQLESVGKVTQVGVVPEALYLMYSMRGVEGRNLTSQRVMDFIATRNALIPGGTLSTEGQNFPVQLSGEFKTHSDLMGAVVGQSAEGAPIYLRDVFEVRRGYENPVTFAVGVLTSDRAKDEPPRGSMTNRVPGLIFPREDGGVQRAVMVAVEMKEGRIIRDFDADVAGAAAAVGARLPEGMRLVRLSDQPEAVGHRVRQFLTCFLEAVVIVILVSLLLMEWRSALVVALAIPLTVAMTFVGMHLLGIPLHQISIAALIIALGMLVDDPVVASDAINREIAAGQSRGVAAWLGPWRLRRAILFATVINIVAFLPLALLPGDKGAFIMALPQVATLSLAASRLVSVTFIPLLGHYFLRGQKSLDQGGELRRFPLFRWVDMALIALAPRYRAVLERYFARPGRLVVVAYGLLALSFGAVPFFGQQFFPAAERNQCLIDVELPASASIFQTRDVVGQIVARLAERPEVSGAGVFYGGTAPRFYYNVSPREPAPYLAQILVNTRHASDVPKLVADLRGVFDREIAGARVLMKQLEQGPPVEYPIQIRFAGEDLDVLRGLADEAGAALRAAGGYKVNDDLGWRMPTLRVDIDQAKANTLGVVNTLIGRVMQSAFGGLKITELREGDHLVPVLVRLAVDERHEASRIGSLYVESLSTRPVPLSSFAEVGLRSEFATVPRHNLLRSATVRAFSPVGELPSEVLRRARTALSAIQVPPGYRMEFAGEAKELKQSQTEMGTVMGLSIALISLALVLQFNSVIKAGVVLVVVPVGLIGAFFGMTVLQTSLGFMALLGIVSLAGVIVSHIIVVSDLIEEARAEGMELKEALIHAGLVRLRAVLVTTLATVGGLVPLALEGGELWRPLTAVHIFGLLFATVLSLVLLPVLYYTASARLRWIR
ncbi:MAG: efflux RND transporter permease subunit [Verrucomicrobiales bacterium]|nr:efflux RND transporter permease subunit [Verrucomicrobiales bacterium]